MKKLLLTSLITLALTGCGGSSGGSSEIEAPVTPEPEVPVTPEPEVPVTPEHCSVKNHYETSEYESLGNEHSSIRFRKRFDMSPSRYTNHCNGIATVEWRYSTDGKSKRISNIDYIMEPIGVPGVQGHLLSIRPLYESGMLDRVLGTLRPSNPEIDEDGFINSEVDYRWEGERLRIKKSWANEWGDVVRYSNAHYYSEDQEYKDFIKLYDENEVKKLVADAKLHATEWGYGYE